MSELDEFRREVEAWFRDNRPPEPDFLLPESFMEVGSDAQFEFLRDWQRKVYEAGYLGHGLAARIRRRRQAAGLSGHRHRRDGATEGAVHAQHHRPQLGRPLILRWAPRRRSSATSRHPECRRHMVPGIFRAGPGFGPRQQPARGAA